MLPGRRSLRGPSVVRRALFLIEIAGKQDENSNDKDRGNDLAVGFQIEQNLGPIIAQRFPGKKKNRIPDHRADE